MSQNNTSIKQRIVATTLVLLQLLIVLFLISTDNMNWRLNPATIVSSLGVLLGFWAIFTIGPTRVSISPNVKPKAKLVTTGPYQYLRHPMYTSLLLFCAGYTWMPLSSWRLAAWAALLLVLLAKSSIEEKQLAAKFPEYASYTETSWRFFPLLY